jgi:hypothetical protein
MVRFLLLDKTTKEVLNPNIQPAPDINQWITDMESLDPSLELVCEYEPYTIPLVDTRLVNITTNQAYVNTNHPIYASLKQWLVTYATSDKTIEDKKVAVDDLEYENNETILPTRQRLKITMLALDSLLDHLGLTNNTTINATALNVKKKKQLRIFKRAANKIRNNDITRDAKWALIDALTNPDLDADWEINDFTENV